MQEDGGDIVYMGFDDGVVKLKMQVKNLAGNFSKSIFINIGIYFRVLAPLAQAVL